MKSDILLILVNNRKEQAPNIQKLLTGWGCIIKTRLGLHGGVLDNCTDTGLIILELAEDKDKNRELARKIDVLPGVNAKLVELSVE
ncbi:MAG: hypothetical protein ABIH74_03760 [Candidatus Omnitrophota bacterium]